jgi:RNA polymerase sigma-70 factor (ECF subfamily)
VLEGLATFEGRSSLSTWIFAILLHRARSRGVRERRSVPLTDLADGGGDEPEPPDDRFLPAGHRWAGHWAAPPRRWADAPDRSLLGAEARALVESAIAALPEKQREVITLRDVQGLGAEEVCNVLGLTETNQRVLLHRARAKVRSALERYFDGDRPA